MKITKFLTLLLVILMSLTNAVNAKEDNHLSTSKNRVVYGHLVYCENNICSFETKNNPLAKVYLCNKRITDIKNGECAVIRTPIVRR